MRKRRRDAHHVMVCQGLAQGFTSKQLEVLVFLVRYTRERGYPPTIREIQENFGWDSNHSAWCHLRLLEKKGAISWEKNKARTIRVMVEPEAM